MILQVNNDPSLLQSTIDSFLNRPMLPEMFNIVGLHIPNESSISQDLQGLQNIKMDCLVSRVWNITGEKRRKTEDINELESSDQQVSHTILLII